ncbi:hypothetical protein TNCV_4189821 [Trichonephila clavipes]|nr:hypothetical protein TNCV_4189821 [Trichonephila clavipes]
MQSYGDRSKDSSCSFIIQYDSLPYRLTCRVCRRYVEDSESHRNAGSCKCRSCELCCKETEKKNSNNNTLMGQKTFYLSVALQHVLEITTRSRLEGLTEALKRILLRSGKYLACHIFSVATDIQAMSLQLKERVSHTTNSLWDPQKKSIHFQTPVTVQPFDKMYSALLMCSCFSSFSLFLCTIGRN